MVVDFGTDRKGVCDFLLVTLVPSCTISNGHISAMGHPIRFMFGSR